MDERFYAKKIELKGKTVDNYLPISCLQLRLKLLAGIIPEHLHRFLEEEKILPEEKNGYNRNSKGTEDQLLLDKAVLRDCKRRSTNLVMAWTYCRKSYEMIPQTWISECREVFGVAENTKNFLINSMNKWKLGLTSNGLYLGNVEIRGGTVQGNGDKKTRTNHLLFMDDLKLFAKSNDQIDSQVNTVYTLSEYIGMEFRIKKCGVLVLKRGKVGKAKSRGLNLPNVKLMKTIDEEGYE